MPRLQGHVAIITGAASGQGLAEAQLFAAEGAYVVMTDIDVAKGEDAARQLGERVLFISHDVAQEDSWRQVVEHTLARFGRIDILVNNAGIYRPRRFQETDRALLDLHYEVNVIGTFLGMQAVYPAMMKQGKGAIVNVASGAGVRGFPGLFAYAGSKWMARGLSKCAAVDLAATNIRVNTILPGAIDTPMLASNGPELLDKLSELVPAKRIGTAQEIAHAALYLASDEASYVFGAELAVCGGALA